MSYGYRLKRGVLLFVSPQIEQMLDVLGLVFEEEGVPLWVTAGIEGPHREFSAHHQVRAIDVRNYYLSKTKQAKMRIIFERATDAFAQKGMPVKIEIETDHWHVEWGDS